MVQLSTALLAGALFGLGMIVSGMVNPAKVIGFLDLAGNWDPTLALVMGGALAVTIPAFRLVGQCQRPFCADRFHLPDKRALDARLIAGSAIFGVGWGLAGVCPGPALVATASGLAPVLGFVAAMVAGMTAYGLLFRNGR